MKLRTCFAVPVRQRASQGLAHGRSSGIAIKNAIRLANRFAAADLPARLGQAIALHGVGAAADIDVDARPR